MHPNTSPRVFSFRFGGQSPAVVATGFQLRGFVTPKDNTMAMRAPSRCTQCSQLATHHGRCDDHQRKPWENPSANTRALTPAERARFKRDVTNRDPNCVCHGECNNHADLCGQPSTDADHIIPISDGGAPKDINNGRGLCHDCHAAITKNQNAQRRRAKKR